MLTFMWANQDKCFKSGVKVMTNGDTVFTVSGGPIQIKELLSVCVTANGASATTLQWQSAPTVGSAATISLATATLANATAGTTVMLLPTTLATAPIIVTAANGGVQVGLSTTANHITVLDGALKLVIATGPTTGTWYHCIRYYPLTPDSIING